MPYKIRREKNGYKVIHYADDGTNEIAIHIWSVADTDPDKEFARELAQDMADKLNKKTDNGKKRFEDNLGHW